jgi:hypothetical protein
MPAAAKAQKVECLNPNTGRRMNIDKSIYEMFLKAIYHTLNKNDGITFTEMVEGVHDWLHHQKISFDGAVDWYAITIKNDLQAKGEIDVYTEKGKKLHRLKK